MKTLTVVASSVLILFLVFSVLNISIVQSWYYINSSFNAQKVSVGINSALALSPNDNPIIVFNNQGIKYAYWTGSQWNIQTVDTSTDKNTYPSLALDSKGNPHICYTGQNQELKYATLTNTTWNIQTINSTHSYDGTPSIAIDTKDKPHIYYAQAMNAGPFKSSVKYASWNSTTWDIQTVDQNGWMGHLVLDSTGTPHIAYHSTSGELRYATWNGTNWDTKTLYRLAGYSSLALDPSGNPQIIFSGAYGIEKAVKTGTTWNIQILSSSDYYGGFISLKLDANTKPQIIHSGDGGLKYLNGSSFEKQFVYHYSKGITSIEGGSFVLDSEENPHISFTHTGDLMYASFGTTQETPTVTPTENPTPTSPTCTVVYILIGAVVIVLVLAVLLRQKRKKN
ncbi:MAG: hypothetical protein NWF01_10180 [Candidatus Bathyarchaeota archaeon]|nr:hypothetical protein [Candidatus Bathyarchaeota archaeon]